MAYGTTLCGYLDTESWYTTVVAWVTKPYDRVDSNYSEAFMLAAILFLVPFQTTWFVDQSASIPGAGTVASPYQSIDYALAQNSTVTGDTIQVAPGLYLENTVDFRGKNVTVVSTAGLEQTEIVHSGAVGSAVKFVSDESAAAVLDGFTIRGGKGTLVGSFELGGGVLCLNSGPVLRNLRIVDCVAFEGAGICVTGSNTSRVRLENSLIEDCVSGFSGGAVSLISGRMDMVQNVFQNNTTERGGGLFMRASAQATMEACVIDGNLATLGGGGILTSDFCYLAIENSIIRDNTSHTAGGALSMYSGTTDISNTLIADNHAVYQGIARVDGQGVMTMDRVTAYRNTQISPSAPLIRGWWSPNPARLKITNSILDHSPNFTDPYWDCDISYSLVDGPINPLRNIDGPGNVVGEPGYWHAPFDLGLFPQSVCVDAGDPASPLDQDGTRADMGAFPFDPDYCGSTCLPSLGVITCTSAPNSTGLGATLTARGYPTFSRNEFAINVYNSPTNQFGFFLTSRSPGNIALGGGSQGSLCIGGRIFRLNETILTDRGTGVITYRPNLETLPMNTPVMAGDTLYFQYWFRDNNPGSTSNTSETIQLTFQ